MSKTEIAIAPRTHDASQPAPAKLGNNANMPDPAYPDLEFEGLVKRLYHGGSDAKTIAAVEREAFPEPRQPSRETVRYRERIAVVLRMQGVNQSAIAEQLGISQQGVSKILRRVDRRELAKMERDVRLIKVKQQHKIDELYFEAMYGWRESKGDATAFKTRDGKRGMTTVKEQTEERKPARPDPRFLEVMIKLLDAERRLWGIGESGGVNVAVNVLTQLAAKLGGPPPEPPPTP